MSGTPPVARRTGRPRRDGREVLGDPTDEILAVAGRLFGAHGVEGTTMARLAAEVGLAQSSLYYYFRGRDEVVAALVAGANVVPLDLVTRIAADPGSVPSKLHRFIRGDVEALCALPFDINEIHRIAARDLRRFDGYWRERRKLERRLASLMRTGVATGELRPLDPRLVTLHLLASDEGTQNWYRLQRGARPARVAETLADLTVAGVLPPGRTLEDVRAEADALSRERPPPPHQRGGAGVGRG